MKLSKFFFFTLLFVLLVYYFQQNSLESKKYKKKDKNKIVFFFVDNQKNKAFIVNKKKEILNVWDLPKQTYIAEIYQDKRLFGLVNNESIYALNNNSKLIWLKEGMYHHDLIVRGRFLYALKREVVSVLLDNQYTFLNDVLVKINLDNKNEQMLFSAYETYGLSLKNKSKLLWYNKEFNHKEIRNDTPSDVYHSNSLNETYDENLLTVFTVKKMTLAVINLSAQKVIRKIVIPRDIASSPIHDTELISKNKLLLFENGTKETGSRVILFDINKHEVLWSIDKDDYYFYTKYRGRAQILNSNSVLITASNQAKVIEFDLRRNIVTWTLDLSQRPFSLKATTQVKGYESMPFN